MAAVRHTIINSYVHTLIDTACSLGIEREELLQPFSTEISMLTQPGVRLDMTFMTRLVQRAAFLSKDPDLGLHVGEAIRPSTLHVIAPILMNCTSLNEMIQLLIKYQKLVSEGGHLSTRKQLNGVELIYQPNPLQIPMTRFQIEGIFSGIVTFTRWMFNDDLRPEKVCFVHTVDHAPSEYKRIFKCPVYFGKEENMISIKREQLDQMIPQADPNLRNQHQSIADQLLSDLKSGRKITLYLQQWLSGQEDHSRTTLEKASSFFKMSKRTLQRHLQHEQTSFNAIHEKVLMEKAQHLLLTTEFSVWEISERLGYLNTSSFFRAFKKWNNTTPKKFRDVFK